MKKIAFLSSIVILVVVAIIIGIVKSNSDINKLNTPISGKQIAVVRVEGVITGGKQEAVFGSVASAETIMENLRVAAKDPNTAIILLRINSPGGSAPASQEIGEEIKRIKKEKHLPILTSMGDVAASGGYWIASCSDKIIANPSTMTGSIGVIMETQSWQELYKKIGVSNYNVKSGAHKDMGSNTRELSVDEKQILQNMVNDIYEQFVDIVSIGRNIPTAKVRALADGRIFTGRQAKAVGLVDTLGNYYDALDIAQKAAGLSGEPDVKEYGQASPWDIFKARVQVSQEQGALLQMAAQILQFPGVKN